MPKLEFPDNASEDRQNDSQKQQHSDFQKQVQHSQISSHQQQSQPHNANSNNQNNSFQRMPQIRISSFASQSANASNIASVLNKIQQQQNENELKFLKNNNDSNVNKNTNNANSDNNVNSLNLSDSVTLSPRTNSNLNSWLKLEKEKMFNSGGGNNQQQSPGNVSAQQVQMGGLNSLIDLQNNNNTDNSLLSNSSNNASLPTTPTSSHKVNSMRRRVRRKHNSPDDQAEALTEMSVRGLNLFRYACIQDGVYQCTECAKDNVQKTFKNKYSFQRHAFLYHEGTQRKVFPCPVCRKEFSRPDKMKNHMKTTHECYIPKDCNFPIPLIMATAAANAQQQLPADLSTSTAANQSNFLMASQFQAAVQAIPQSLPKLDKLWNEATG